MKYTNPIFWLILGGVCVHLSCNVLPPVNRPPSVGSATEGRVLTDTVSVEIFVIRLAPHQHELLQQLWQEVDEQSLPPQLRRELFDEGFRVGILGSLLSPALAQLLNISAEGRVDIPWGEMQEMSAAEAAREPTSVRNVRNLLPEDRALVKVFDTSLPEHSLFWLENEMVCSQTFTNALGILCVSAAANKDGSAQIHIVPELEYGVAELRLRVVAAMIIQDPNRPRHSFESLSISQRLLPGQWLIMGTTTPDAAGAGKAFFVRRNSGLEQRLVAIRLLKVIPAALAPTSASPTVPRGTETIMPERN